MGALIYRSPFLYNLAMRLLHAGHFDNRYEVLAEEIPQGATVVELCSGDAYLYRHFLRQKNAAYIGLDNSPHFVEAGKKRGIDMRLFDVHHDAIPAADVVLMQASIHIFHTEAEGIIRRMIDSARMKALVTDPIRNLSSSPNPVVATVAKLLTKPFGVRRDHSFRYNSETLSALFAKFQELERTKLDSSGREMTGVFRGRCRS